MDRGYGTIHWTDAVPDDVSASLREMRRRMLTDHPLDAGVFIGGMEGIFDEYGMLAELRPQVPRLPITGPGGAARSLEPGADPTSRRLAEWLSSSPYPALAHELVVVLAAG